MRRERLRTLGWLLGRYMAPYWPAVGLLIVTSYAATVLAGLLPVLMAPILDLALGRGVQPATGGLGGLSLNNLGAMFFRAVGIEHVASPFTGVFLLCAAYVAVGVAKAFVDFGNYLLVLWIRIRAGAAMQRDLFRHLLGLSLGFFTRQRTGELVSRLETDTRSATSGLETIVGTVLTAPVLIAFYGYLLVRTSPRLVLAALAAAALHWSITRAIRRPIRRLATAQFSIFADVAARFQEAFLSIRVVKSLGAEAFELKRLGALLRESLRLHLRFGAYKHAEEPARAVVNSVVEATILLLAAWELMAGRLAVPTFFLFLYVGRAVIGQLGSLGSAYTQMQTILAACARVEELFAQRPAVVDGPDDIDAFGDRIVVRDVAFDYGGEPVLERVDLEVARGEIVAFVGPSGAGKSTLADLILRFCDPARGTITIDGRDLRTLRQGSYRRLFGVVPQEALLLNASIRDNIAYGREAVSDADIEEAARIANATEFIRQMPDGYGTIVGDRGIRLSGGQRQRIALARAIVGNPPILILDEATSSLDSESERLVQQAIERMIEGATSIVIAHRLSTVFRAHKIVVLNRGRVEAIGRHAELLARSETYSHLYRLQFADAEAAPRVQEVTR
jgi:ATP-binding cassette, subfamily B, bacterial MsbA